MDHVSGSGTDAMSSADAEFLMPVIAGTLRPLRWADTTTFPLGGVARVIECSRDG